MSLQVLCSVHSQSTAFFFFSFLVFSTIGLHDETRCGTLKRGESPLSPYHGRREFLMDFSYTNFELDK